MALLTGALQGLERALQSELKFEMGERQRREDRHWKQLAHDRGLAQDAALAEYRASTLQQGEERLEMQSMIAEYQKQIAEDRAAREAERWGLERPHLGDYYANRNRLTGAQAGIAETELRHLDPRLTHEQKQRELEYEMNQQIFGHRKKTYPIIEQQAEENLAQSQAMNPRIIRDSDYLHSQRQRMDTLREQYMKGQITRQEFDLESAKIMRPLDEAYRRKQIAALDQSTQQAAERHPYELYNLEQLGKLYDARIAAAKAQPEMQGIDAYDFKDIQANAFKTGKHITDTKQHRALWGDRQPTPREFLSYLRTLGSNRYAHYLRLAGGDANKAHRMLAMEWSQVMATEEVHEWVKKNASGIGAGKQDMGAIEQKLGMAFMQMVSPNNWEAFMGEKPPTATEAATPLTPEEETSFRRKTETEAAVGAIMGGAGGP